MTVLPRPKKARKKILIFTTVHPAFDVRVFHLEAVSLAAAGHRVELLVHADFTEQVRDGVRVLGIPRPGNRFFRALNILRFLWIVVRRRADVYHFHDLELLPFGVLLRALRRRRVIYDCHENYPETAYERDWYPDSFKPMVARLIETFEPVLARRLDRVICVVDDQESRFRRKGCSTILVRNFPRIEPFERALKPTRVREEMAVYVGGLTLVRGAELLVDIMAELRRTHPALKLLCLGRFNEPHVQRRVLNKIRDLDLEDQFIFPGFVPHEQVPGFLVRARVGIIPFLSNAKLLRMFFAIKAFEYMACGLPIVASDLPSLRDLLVKAGCGILVPPGDASAHAGAIAELLDNGKRREEMAQRGIDYVHRHFNWSDEETKLIELYRSL